MYRAPPKRSERPPQSQDAQHGSALQVLLDDGVPGSRPTPYSLLEPEVTGLEEGPEQVGGVGSSEPMDQSGQGARVGKKESKEA